MTVVTPGSQATLKAAKAESQLLELLTFLKLMELQPNKNPEGKNNVSINYNVTTQLANISFTVDATPQINNLGQMVTIAKPYLVNTGFTPGTGGTFVSSTPEAYLLELLSFIQIKESDPTKNLNSENNVAFTYDVDRNTFSGSVTLPIETSLQNDGNVKITAKEYLKD